MRNDSLEAAAANAHRHSAVSGRGFAVKTTAARKASAPDAREIVTRVSRCAMIRSKRPQQTPIAASLFSGRGFAVKTTAAGKRQRLTLGRLSRAFRDARNNSLEATAANAHRHSAVSGRGFAVKTTAAGEASAPDAREIVTRVPRCAMIRILPIFAARLGLGADQAAGRPKCAFVRRACGGVRFQRIPASKNRALNPTQDEARDLF